MERSLADVPNNLGATSMRFSSPTGRLEQGIRHARRQRRSPKPAAITVFTTAIGNADSKKTWMRILAARAASQLRQQNCSLDATRSTGSPHSSSASSSSSSDDGHGDDELSGPDQQDRRAERRIQRRVHRLLLKLTPLQQMAAERMLCGQPLQPALASLPQFQLPPALLRLLQPQKPGMPIPRPPTPYMARISATTAVIDYELAANAKREALWNAHTSARMDMLGKLEKRLALVAQHAPNKPSSWLAAEHAKLVRSLNAERQPIEVSERAALDVELANDPNASFQCLESQCASPRTHGVGVGGTLSASGGDAYWEQGTTNRFENKSAQVARDELKKHPVVVSAIDRLWVVVTEYSEDPFVRLGLARYISLSVMLQKMVLEPQHFDVFNADRTARTEWIRDTRPASPLSSSAHGTNQEDVAHQEVKNAKHRSMSLAEFHDAMFEFADLWCDRVSASDYGSFLWQLTQRLTTIKIVFKDSSAPQLQTKIVLPHSQAGAAKWHNTRQTLKNVPITVRYQLRKQLANLQSIHEKADKEAAASRELFTHPYLYEAAEAEIQTLRSNLATSIEKSTATTTFSGRPEASKGVMTRLKGAVTLLRSASAVHRTLDSNIKAGASRVARLAGGEADELNQQMQYDMVTGRKVHNFAHVFSTREDGRPVAQRRRRVVLRDCQCRRCQDAALIQCCYKGMRGRNLARAKRAQLRAVKSVQAVARGWLHRSGLIAKASRLSITSSLSQFACTDIQPQHYSNDESLLDLEAIDTLFLSGATEQNDSEASQVVQKSKLEPGSELEIAPGDRRSHQDTAQASEMNLSDADTLQQNTIIEDRESIPVLSASGHTLELSSDVANTNFGTRASVVANVTRLGKRSNLAVLVESNPLKLGLYRLSRPVEQQRRGRNSHSVGAFSQSRINLVHTPQGQHVQNSSLSGKPRLIQLRLPTPMQTDGPFLLNQSNSATTQQFENKLKGRKSSFAQVQGTHSALTNKPQSSPRSSTCVNTKGVHRRGLHATRKSMDNPRPLPIVEPLEGAIQGEMFLSKIWGNVAC